MEHKERRLLPWLVAGNHPAPGGGSGYYALVEQYNGSSWTEIADLNTARNGFNGRD